MLLPPSIEDYIGKDNPVRAIDAYVGSLDLSQMDFQHTQEGTGMGAGQPPIPPGALLKLYLYGYLNRVHSSRRLERETRRNLEVIWLVQGLAPSFKTIADFRKSNGKALKAVNKDFVLLCRELKLFGGTEVAIDGSFFKGDTSPDSIYTAKRLEMQLASLEEKIESYQRRLEEQDAQDDRAGLGSLEADNRLAEKIARLKEKQALKQELKKKLEEGEDGKQISTVDPDARLLSKNGKVTAGYNVQIAVDGKNQLIVAAEVTQDGNDQCQLVPMLEKARESLEAENLVGIADAGYCSGEQLRQAEARGFEVYVATRENPEPAQEGGYTRDQYVYDETKDAYICPQGETLESGGNLVNRKGRLVRIYRSSVPVCRDCPVREKCLSGKAQHKMLERWEHEEVVERHKRRMKNAGDRMKKRSQWVEHPFGTLKHRAGMHHFLMRGLEKCTGEFNLMVVCYNFTRVMNLVGWQALRDYCVQRLANRQKNPVFA